MLNDHLTQFLDTKQMQLKLFQIARIIAQRMRAQIALVFEVLEELGEVLLKHAVLKCGRLDFQLSNLPITPLY